MARGESQTLLIWTIIFLIFSLIMIIVSVVMRSKYTEAASQLADATQKNSQLNSEVNNLKTESTRLREMIGLPDTSLAIAEVETSFAEHMRIYAPSLPQGTTSYRSALIALNDSYQDKITENKSLNQLNKTLQEDNSRQVANLNNLRNEMQTKLDEATKQFQEEVAELTQLKDNALASSKTLEEEKNKYLADARASIDDANKRRAEMDNRNAEILKINAKLVDTVVNFESPTPTYHNAEVMWINSDSTTVRINVGSNHGLRPRMPFSVYASDVNEISVESSKGKIEVTKIIDGNTAEARVTEDILINPIIPGDIIYTPVWKPGQKIHFALSSNLDLDGDGATDPHKVIGLIQRSGGEVDAYIDDLTGDMIDEGGKKVREAFSVGRISDETRYFVTGDKPDPDSSVTLFNARRDMEEEAKLYGLIEISLKDLLNFMGQRPQSQTVGFGPRNRAINNYEMEPDVVNQRMPGNVFRKYEDEDAEPASNKRSPVSPLFNQRKVTNPTGTVSPLFQPKGVPAKETE